VVPDPVHARPSSQTVVTGWFDPPPQAPEAAWQTLPLAQVVFAQATDPEPMQAPAALQAKAVNWLLPLHLAVAFATVQAAPVVAV